jgi:farnesyl diphosphate synthase
VYRLLARHFKEQPCYVNLVDLFLEVTYKTELGQLLDLITAPTGKPDLEKFSPLRYQQIVQYKTSFYSFYLPVALAMIYCGVDGKELLGEARKCLIPLGEFFQIQDDFLDCFGDSKILGKIGTDIDEGKCSWLAMKFMEIASDAELKVFKEIYSTPGSTAVISKMYKEAELDQEYERLQEATKKTLNETLLTISDPKLVLIIESFAKKIFNRQK